MTERHVNIPAAYAVFIQNGKTLLLRRFNTGFADGQYSLAAGHVEPGETLTECVIRETAEETGIVLQPDQVEVAHVMHRNRTGEEQYERIDVFYIVHHWQGQPSICEPDKCDDLGWFDLAQLPENTVPYVREALEHIQQEIRYSEYGWHTPTL